MNNNKPDSEIIIVGAGAAGLMAAWELSKAGKKVTILEARDRIGGRIWPLSEKDFGYPAQGGAEFVHGAAPITKSLIHEAGLKFVATDGEIWKIHEGTLEREGESLADGIMAPNQVLHKKLEELKEDIPIAEFFNKYFSEEQYVSLRQSVIRTVEGYDAADANKISTFSLREEWLGRESEWQHGKIIKEGYGALLNFLESECRKDDVQIYFEKKVEAVEMLRNEVSVVCANGEKYEAEKIVLALPLPVLVSLKFTPTITEKMDAVSKIGFGNVIKILLRFKNEWWENALGKDLSKLGFLYSQEVIPTWWTQYPESQPVLTGWLAGPNALKFKNVADEEILDVALTSLSNIFKIHKETLEKDLINSKIINWPADPLTQGAYSYSMVGSEVAYAELRKPVNNKIFFAGEALCMGKESATVEGALASGMEVAKEILNVK